MNAENVIQAHASRHTLVAIVFLLVSGVLNVITWVATRFFPVNDPAAVLHYSIDIGVDFIGQGEQIMVLPLIGSLLIVFNTILGFSLVRANWRAAWVLWTVMPVVQLILLGVFFLLWRINA